MEPCIGMIFDVQCPPFDLELSHWDRICPPTHSKRLLCFSTAPGVELDQIIKWLRYAFFHTVQEHPFLGGSVIQFDYGRPWLRNIVPRGAARLRVHDLSTQLSFSELKRSNFAPNLLKAEELCTFTHVAYVTGDPVDVCAFTATFIAGGMILAVEIFHVAADAFGVTEIIKTFASQFVLAQSLSQSQSQSQSVFAATEEKPSGYRQLRPQLVHSGGSSKGGNILNHPAYGSSSTDAFAAIPNSSNPAKSFRISAEHLVALKQFVSSGLGPGQWITTADAISALIWRSVIRSRRRAGHFIIGAGGSAAGDDTFLSQAVDFRQQLLLPKTYLGNAVYMTKVAVRTEAIIAGDGPCGIAAAAKALRADVKAVTADRVRDFLGYVEGAALESHTCVNIFHELTTSGIILTNHFKFDLHAIDFGSGAFVGGRIQALRFPERGIMRGAVIVMPKLSDGGCEFLVTELDDTLAELAKDDMFCRFVQEEVGVVGESVVPVDGLQNTRNGI